MLGLAEADGLAVVGDGEGVNQAELSTSLSCATMRLNPNWD